MFRLQCLLTFAALYVGFARSWDIAVTTIDKLEFYDNGTKTFSQEDARFKYLSALTYDAVHNMLLFADKNNDNASIFSFYIANKKYQALVRKSPNENIHGLAFDPVTGLLFWTDTNRTSIYCNSLSPGSRKEAYGTIMFQMKDEIPGGIAVDSCRGYIYWTNTNITKPTIERARLNGSEREVIVSRDIHMPISIAVDQQTKRIYWTDDKEGMQYTIESADLDGKHRTILFEGTDDHRSNALTVSKNSIYWLDSNTNTIWKLPKHVSRQSVPVEYAVYRNENPFAIVANYPIEEQIRDQRCETLENLSANISAIQSLSIPSDVGLFCLHGKKVVDKPLCNCTPGYTGERCEISRCQNYCFEGNCSFTTDGQPICSCNDGYAGIRCETNICENQCLNNGTCSLNKYNEPTCLCIGDYEGARCETLKIVTMMTDKPPSTIESLSSECNCTSTQNETKLLYHVSSETQSPSSVSPPPETTSPIMEELVASCTPDWDSVRDPAIMALGILSGLLCLLCVVLITKILQLKKRPRIKKRIIVNKNVTPLTARPDQCEITIENCCNMNICETPCFEPRSTIRPKLLDSKDGKDEKKNLIANMEYPDDPY